MARFYLAAQKELKGKYYAFTFSVKPGENLVFVIQQLGVKIAEVCPTKKSAEALADEWDKTFRDNGTSIFC